MFTSRRTPVRKQRGICREAAAAAVPGEMRGAAEVAEDVHDIERVGEPR
jgi:hypothetical protein